jgi:transposase-like protein
MSQEVTVNKDDLLQVYRDAKAVVRKLQLLIAEVGCLHRNKRNITTMGGADDVQKFYCPDCGDTFNGV